MNSNHRVNVVRVNEILPHPNADSLGIVEIGGYQCVVKSSDFKPGDLAVYIQPDSVVPVTKPFEFLWGDKYFGTDVPERKRRITVRKFRGEWSEGLLLPLESFFVIEAVDTVNDVYYTSLSSTAEGHSIKEGDDLAGLLGIAHYEESEPGVSLGKQGRKLTLWQRILKFFGYKPKPYGPKNAGGVYDVESLKNYPRVFTEGEEVLVTEKIHGSNARFVFDGKKFWVGSHNRWCQDLDNIWGEVAKKYPWIEEFCRAWPGYTLRGEVTPTQKGYPYGFETEKQFFAFDVQKPGDAGYMTKEHLFFSTEMKQYIQRLVPVVYRGPYSSAIIKGLAEGNSLVAGAKNIREGIVVSSLEERHVRGVGRAQLKLKSLKFLEKEVK